MLACEVEGQGSITTHDATGPTSRVRSTGAWSAPFPHRGISAMRAADPIQDIDMNLRNVAIIAHVDHGKTT
ncbi:hypothetical protein, partial [uncultured Sphingomonas sp.]|uniref:hypothetical protein n=1 Tax=uncultured Sphingomonas sp. TaxID=158754 RepID=UPI0035C981FD